MLAESEEGARRHLPTALELLMGLGFIINLKKSIFIPARKL